MGVDCRQKEEASFLLKAFVIGNKVADLDRNKLLKIGTSPKDVERRKFQ